LIFDIIACKDQRENVQIIDKNRLLQVVVANSILRKWKEIPYSVSHDPFLQNMLLIFYMLISNPFTLKIKCYTPSQGKGTYFIFSLDNLKEW